MYRLAKGIVRYICIATIGIAAYSAGHSPAAASAKTECTDMQKKQISSLELSVSKASQTLKLEGISDKDGRCTLMEQRVIIGRGRRTPDIDSYIEEAWVNPRWTPTYDILQEMKKKHPKDYMQKHIYHEDGAYMRPGPNNPLGKVKFIFPVKGYFRLHGTSDDKRDLFKREHRKLSHGCIRAEDEVSLLEIINTFAGNTDDCDTKCIDRQLKSGRTRKLTFRKKIRIKVK